MARHHRKARETHALPGTVSLLPTKKIFARICRSWVELADA